MSGKVKSRVVARGGGSVGGQKALPNPTSPTGAGQVWNPGVPTPTIAPFLTGEDIMAYSEAKKSYENELSELDFNYANTVANTGYEKDQITKGAVQGKADTNWDMAGRGLARSSIRDADLFDIDATAEMRKTFLDTQLNTLKLTTETRKHSLDEAWNNPETGYLHGLELKKISNAQGANAGLPQWQTAPHFEKPPTPAKPPQQPKKQANPNGPVQGPTLSPPKKPVNGGTTYQPGPKPPARRSVGGQKILGRMA